MRELLKRCDAPTLRTIASRIYHNECGGNPEYLVHWNEGENFLSLGIGHFIWYPPGATGIYTEVFPLFIRYLQRENVALPEDLPRFPPWPDRQTFLREQRGTAALRLRDFLLQTSDSQAAFIVSRAGVLLEDKFSADHAATARLEILLRAPDGIYPVVDYLNFKGDGIAASECYRGQGWGLLQVLEKMPPPSVLTQTNVLREFVAAAQQILEERVANAPPERHEERWLPGWRARLASYSNTE